MLGFMIECNHINEDDDYSQHSGSNDANSYVTEEGCARSVIWAAYVSIFFDTSLLLLYSLKLKYNTHWRVLLKLVGLSLLLDSSSLLLVLP